MRITYRANVIIGSFCSTQNCCFSLFLLVEITGEKEGRKKGRRYINKYVLLHRVTFSPGTFSKIIHKNVIFVYFLRYK